MLSLRGSHRAEPAHFPRGVLSWDMWSRSNPYPRHVCKACRLKGSYVQTFSLEPGDFLKLVHNLVPKIPVEFTVPQGSALGLPLELGLKQVQSMSSSSWAFSQRKTAPQNDSITHGVNLIPIQIRSVPGDHSGD